MSQTSPEEQNPSQLSQASDVQTSDGTLTRYRAMATIVGVLLVVLILIGMPLKYLMADGSTAQHVGEWITSYLGVAHGWLYMIFLVTAFLLARRERWSIGFSAITLVCGTIPILSFWAERRATRAVRSADAAGAAGAAGAGVSGESR